MDAIEAIFSAAVQKGASPNTVHLAISSYSSLGLNAPV
jgi:hypothetical protein